MEIPAESVAPARVKASGKPRSRASKRRARVPFDGRSVLGRRVKELTIAFREHLRDADPDPLLLTNIKRAAELQALAEQAAARALRADPKVAYDDVVRLSRLAEHAVRRLKLDRHDARPRTESVHEYVARTYGSESAP